MTPEFLNDLNDSQRKAVEYIDGPSLVIAGAGSGKTRVLTYKVAYLLTQGYRPWEIMALTFTNKAAREMQERIARLVGGDDARYLRMGTFHSVFARLLRSEAERLGYTATFTIYDEDDSVSLCKSIIKDLELDDKVYRPREVRYRISEAKNKLMRAEDYAKDTYALQRDGEAKRPRTAEIYSIYQKRSLQSNVMDFDDLLLNTYLLLKNHPEVRERYAEMYRFFLVDEYQDTNYAQQKIVYLLASGHKHVCVVGDDAQSIYGFRGANIDNILDFQRQYEGAKLFKLERNYRSTQRIVQAANSLITHNQRQIEKNVYSENAEGEKIVLMEFASDKEEAISVCKDIKRRMRYDAIQYSDCAILYRTHSQSRAFEEQMMKLGIPYKVYGGMSFYQRKEIKDIIAYFRVVVNPDDSEALRRIINYPSRGIGDTTIRKIADNAQQHGVTMWQVLTQHDAATVGVNKGTWTKLQAFRDMMCSYMDMLKDSDAFTLGQEIAKTSGITAEIYSSKEPEYLSRQENIEEFFSSMQDYVETAREQGDPASLVDFLHEVALLTDKDGEDDERSKVMLMTIHSAKGLEFPSVYVVGMEENIFPSPQSTDSMRKLEEERRLLYVAITRAERFCTLTYARSRYRYGHMDYDQPSRFLRDIDQRLITRVESGFPSFSSSSSPERFGHHFAPDSTSNSRPAFGSISGSRPAFGSTSGSRPAPGPASFQRPSRVESGSPAFSSSSSQRPAPQFRKVSSTTGSSDALPTVSSINGLELGSKVMHDRFGVGIVKRLEGSGDSAKATVEFVNAGTKQLLLKFAKIKLIG